MVSEINVVDNSSMLTVKSKPEIVCSNGIRIVLGSDDETFDITLVLGTINRVVELLETIKVKQ
jgi:hypothetical protein